MKSTKAGLNQLVVVLKCCRRNHFCTCKVYFVDIGQKKKDSNAEIYFIIFIFSETETSLHVAEPSVPSVRAAFVQSV